MSLWRLSIATGLGLAWYYSDCGRTVTQYFVCLLLCCCAPLLYANSGRESGTQTDEEAEKLSQVKGNKSRNARTHTDVAPRPNPDPVAPSSRLGPLSGTEFSEQEMRRSIIPETNKEGIEGEKQ